MSRSFRIEAFARFAETVELLWLRGLEQDQDGNWTATAFVRDLETKQLDDLRVPLGLVPVLVPGQVFHNGRIGTVPSMGQLGRCTVASLRQFERVMLADVPSSVFSDRQPRHSRQELLLYPTGKLDLFIPPLEIVRRLFLFDRTLANVVLRKGGLAELCVPIKPGFYDEIELNFTAAMPPKALTKAFVRRFAWLAVHPTGVRAWKRIERLSSEQKGITLDPPEIKDCQISFRGLVGFNAVLVHEILELRGLRDPVRKLRFSHPQLRQPHASTGHGPALSQGEDEAGETRSKVERVYNVNEGATGVSNSPDSMAIQRLGNDFAGEIRSIQRHYRPAEESTQIGPKASHARSDEDENGPPTTVSYETVQLSVSDIATQPQLKPMSFRILEPASPNYLGELETLIDTLRRMQDLIPAAIRISAALCALPKDGPISWVGQYRRPCLVALFRCPAINPIVLLDVDHGGNISLSALSLHFAHPATPLEVEHAVVEVLESLGTGGHWPSDLENQYENRFEVRRLKRMLRRQSRATDSDYQTKWAAMLVERLGLVS